MPTPRQHCCGAQPGVLVTHTDTLPDGAPALVVADTLAALTALGKAGRARFAGKMVAVTGSVGKTTTKEMLRTVLSRVRPHPRRPGQLQQTTGACP